MRMSNYKNRTRLLALLLVLVEVFTLMANVAYGMPGEGQTATATTLEEVSPAAESDAPGDGGEAPSAQEGQSAEEGQPAEEGQSAQETLTAEAEQPAGEEQPAEQEPSAEEGQPAQEESAYVPSGELREITARITTSDGVFYDVAVAYDAAALPEDVSLALRELTPAPVTEQEAAAALEAGRPFAAERFVTADEQSGYDAALTEALQMAEDDLEVQRSYLDMTLYSGGMPVQPKAPVQVTVTTDAVSPALSDGAEPVMLTQTAAADENGETRIVTDGTALAAENGTVVPAVPQYDEQGRAIPAPAVLRFDTDHLATLGVAVLAAPARTINAHGVEITLYAPRGCDVAVSAASAGDVSAENDVLLAFRPVLTAAAAEGEESPAILPDRGFAPALWLSARITGETPKNWGNGGMVGLRSDENGSQSLFDHAETAAPVRIYAGDTVAVLWDTGLRRGAVSDGNVSVNGLLPVNAVLTAESVAVERLPEGLYDGFHTVLAAFDMNISADGDTYLPGGARPVKATVSGLENMSGKDVTVWRLADDGSFTPVNVVTEGKGFVTFTAAEGGTYAVIGSSRTNTAVAGDGCRYEVSVTYTRAAGIPDDAVLTVRQITGAEYAAYYYRTQARMKVENYNALSAYDISFILPDGTEAEPQAPVDVSIRMLRTPLADTQIVHYAADGPQVISPDVSADGTQLDFTADSFSVFVLCARVTDGDYTYVAVQKEIKVSELLTALEVTDFELADVTMVAATETDLVSVTPIEEPEKDWQLQIIPDTLPHDTIVTLTLAGDTPVQIKFTNPYALTITAGSASKVYDGNALNGNTLEELTIAKYTADGLQPGHAIAEITLEGSQTQLGSSEYVASGAVIKDDNGAGDDVTDQYVITYVPGTLTVTWPAAALTKEITGFQGDLATYKITVNPDAAGGALNEGEDLVLRDDFSATGTDLVDQKINYDTVTVKDGDGNPCNAVSYDFSGTVGTFTIPDGTTVIIEYQTSVLGKIGREVTFGTRAQLGRMDGSTFVPGAVATTERTETITPTGTHITGTGGVYSIKLYTYASGKMEEGLEGAEFRLLDSNMQPILYKAGAKVGQEVTFTTGANGYVDIKLNEDAHGLAIRKNTLYYLEMVTAPYVDGIAYQKDNTYYSFIIADDPSYGGESHYSYVNGDVLKVRCYPESKGVNITVRFSGSYTPTPAEMNAIQFVLQKENLDIESRWEDVEGPIAYNKFNYGTYTFRTGSDEAGAAELEDFATYQVKAENYTVPGIDVNVYTDISYRLDGQPVNDESTEFEADPVDKAYSYRITFTFEYVDHKLSIVKIDGGSGIALPGAVFKTYAVGNDTDAVASYTTDNDGKIDIRKDDNDIHYQADRYYYAVEDTAPGRPDNAYDYVKPADPEKFYFYFPASNNTPQGLPEGAKATDLTHSYNTITLPNGRAVVDVPVSVVWGISGADPWPVNVKNVVVGLYKSVGGADPVAVTGEGDAPLRVTLDKNNFYDNSSFTGLPALVEGQPVTYSVVEESVTNYEDEEIIDQYARSSSISGTGWYVVQNQGAISVKVTKQWYEQNGSQVADISGMPAVTVDLYRTTAALPVADKTYTREEMLEFLSGLEPVRTVTIPAGTAAMEVKNLQEKDSAGNDYLYYAVEQPIDNQDDSYQVAAAQGDTPRELIIKNQKTPVTITIQVNNASKTYGDADPDYTFTAAVQKNGSSVAISEPDGDGIYTATVTADDAPPVTFRFRLQGKNSENVGTYTITPVTVEGYQAAIDEAGYRVRYTAGTLTINRATAIVTTEGKTKVYGTADPQLYTVQGLKYSEPVSVLTFTAEREEGEDVGTYPITLEGEAVQGNYNVVYRTVNPDDPTVRYDFTITPAPVTVRAENKTKTYGDPDPEFTAVIDGLKNGDAATVISYELTREQGEDVGTYAINATNPTNNPVQGNYEVTFVNAGGTLTIGKALLTISVDNEEITYGDPEPEYYIDIDGLKNGDEDGTLTHEGSAYTYTVNGETPTTLLTFTLTRPEGLGAGEYPLTLTGPAALPNYDVTFVNGEEGGKLTIGQAELIITPDHIVKALGVADPPLTAHITGWQYADGDVVPSYTHNGETGVDTWTYQLGQNPGDDDLVFSLKRAPGDAEDHDYLISFQSVEQPTRNYRVVYDTDAVYFNILSVLEIEVAQQVVDHAEPTASPAYTYTATIDLTGSGLSAYEDENFAMTGGKPTCEFALQGATVKVLKVPGGAKLTVKRNDPAAQTAKNYTTAIQVDSGEPQTVDDMTATVSAITYHRISFIHSRVSLPVEARYSDSHSDTEGVVSLPAKSGAIGIPDGERAINWSFAGSMQALMGYELPTNKYYVYDHAVLYDGDTAVEHNVTTISYNEETGRWMYNGTGLVPEEGATLVLFYYPEYVCKVGDEQKFFTLNEAVEYARGNGGTATIEMLIGNYEIRSASSAVTIQAGDDITLTTATGPDYQGTGTAVISRAAGYTAGPLFIQQGGALRLENVTLDGNSVQTGDAMIRVEAGQLDVGASAVLQNAIGSNGGAIYAAGGTVSLSGAVTGNTATNGGAVYMTGTAELTVNATASVAGNTATANGGAVYMADGTMTIAAGAALGAAGNENSATNGGGVYMTGGTLTVNGSMSGNRASNGGAVYMTGTAELTVSANASVTGNTATENGGAVYLANGTMTIAANGAIGGANPGQSNTAVNGGGIYQAGGTLTVSGSMLKNSATNGGAVYLAGGSMTVTGGSMNRNSATGNGGGIYGAGGTISVTGGSIGEKNKGNTAVNGGGMYLVNATVEISGGNVKGNSATENGGGIYTVNGSVTMTGGNIGSTTGDEGNSAAVNGGGIYAETGIVTYSGGNIQGNTANNGAAIFTDRGTVNISATIKNNSVREDGQGGAVGVGTTLARLNFSGNAYVYDNKVSGKQHNVYLNQPSDQIINVPSALNKSKQIGIYVPGDVDSTQVMTYGDLGGYFGTYADVSNVESTFKSDHYTGLSAKSETGRIYWSAALNYDVLYKQDFNVSQPPAGGVGFTESGYSTIATAQTYYPKSVSYSMYDLVALMGLNALKANTAYAYTYANNSNSRLQKPADDQDLSFDQYVTSVQWNRTGRKWEFIRNDTGLPAENATRLAIIYSQPTYLSVTNNNADNLVLDITGLTVNNQPVVTATYGYGYATAKNGATVEHLIPVTPSDLVLHKGESVKLMFPGAAGKNFALNGLPAETDVTYTIKRGDADTEPSRTINAGNPINVTGTNKLISCNTVEIVFGEPLPICRLLRDEGDGPQPVETDENGGEYATLQAAVAAMQADALTYDAAYTIEMLVDYLIPKGDVLKVDGSYNLTVTTSQGDDFKGANQKEGTKPARAILSRDYGNNGSSVETKTTAADNVAKLRVENLIFDGRAVAGTGNGGAVSTKYYAVVIDNCDFNGYRANVGGAVFVVRGGTFDQTGRPTDKGPTTDEFKTNFKDNNVNDILKDGLTVRNCKFTDCLTAGQPDKSGGGGIWTTSKGLLVENCTFDGCGCTGGKAQAGAVFHNIMTSDLPFEEFKGEGKGGYTAAYPQGTLTVIRNSTFSNCYAVLGSAGTMESDAAVVVVENSTFSNGISHKDKSNGGALNIFSRNPNYNNNNPSQSAFCWLTVKGCTFEDCHTAGNGKGGAIRAVARYTELIDTTFRNTYSGTGGAACVDNSDAVSLTIEGCTFEGNTAMSNTANSVLGGAVYTKAPTVEIRNTTVTSCEANGGGGVYQDKDSGTMTIADTTFTDCRARTGSGGGVYTKAKTLTVTSTKTGGQDSTVFTRCTAQVNGGGICHDNQNRADITGKFDQCSAKTGQGGALSINAKTVNLTDVTITDCQAATMGGGVWMNGGNTSTMTSCQISSCSAAADSNGQGGGLYVYAGTLKYKDSQVTDCSAHQGGGVYYNSGTLHIYGDAATAISGSAVAGGGLYQAGGTVNHRSGTVFGTAGTDGGGVYQADGTYTIGNGKVDSISYTNPCIGNNDDSDTLHTARATGSGGGLYQAGGTLNADTGSRICGTASGDGGGVYQAAGTVNVNSGSRICGTTDAGNGGGLWSTANVTQSGGTVSGSAVNGGGVYVGGGTVTMSNGAVSGSTATGSGGGVYVTGSTYTVSGGTIGGEGAGNTAANGGGVYVNSGAFAMTGGAVSGNTANGNGGGVYWGGGTCTLSGGTIGGEGAGNTASGNGGGVFVANGLTLPVSGSAQITHNNAQTAGGGIAVGGSTAALNFSGNAVVRDNTMGSVTCNVYLDHDSNTIIKNSGLGASAWIGVYAADDCDEDHGLQGKPFATRADDNYPGAYHNDRRIYLYGVKGDGGLVQWANFVCKITDGAGKLLYQDNKGTPAVYDTLENKPSDSSLPDKTAFKVLGNAEPNLYYWETESNTYKKYTGTGYQVQMLVPAYSFQQIKLADNRNRQVTLTTASTQPDECGFRYAGNASQNAVLTRKADKKTTVPMIFVARYWELTLKDITLNGGGDAYGGTTEAGAIIHVKDGGKATLETGATLYNGKTNNNYDGGAVCVDTSTCLFTMKAGSRIMGCTSAANGGAVAVASGSTFVMEGGTIGGAGENAGNTAQNGGGVYVANGGTFRMQGGTISENTAAGMGGGVALPDTGSVAVFSGYCTVKDNHLTADPAHNCDVQLGVRYNTEPSPIRAGRLDSRSWIGVYTTGDETATNSVYYNHGNQGEEFGTLETDGANVFGFVNDRNTEWRGFLKESDPNDSRVYWEYHPMLQVQKIVESDLTADTESTTYHFQVFLTNTNAVDNNKMVTGKFGDMTFTNAGKDDQDRYVGKCDLYLKKNEWVKTAVLDSEHANYIYKVQEVLTSEQQYYTTTTLQNGKATGTDLTVSGTLGENVGGEHSTSLSTVVFTNSRVTGSLTVSNEVVSSEPEDMTKPYRFKVTMDGIVADTVEYPVTGGTLTFTNGESEVFTLTDSQSVTISGLPTGAAYTVQELLDDTKIRTDVKKNDGDSTRSKTISGTINDHSAIVGGQTVYTSHAHFKNTRLPIVCKITNKNGLLYYYDNGVLQPAVYSHLEDAFEPINKGELRTANGGNVSGTLNIEMLVPTYTMERQAECRKSVLLTTASLNVPEEQYPYNNGHSDNNGNIAVVYRGFTDGSMIESKGTMTLDQIVLDGGAEFNASGENTGITANADGGIIKMLGAVRLNVNQGAVLRNSVTTGNGGAIYLDKGEAANGPALKLNGTAGQTLIENCAAANGGAVYATNFSTISASAVISNCRATTGNGGALYADGGARIDLLTDTVLRKNSANGNGGAVYADNVPLYLKGIIGGTEAADGNRAGGNGGGVYTGAGTMFTLFTGSSVRSNRADGNGGGIAAEHDTKIVSGIVSNNTAGGNGGGVYAATDTAGNAVVLISGKAELKDNQTTTGNGGAVYLANRNITMNMIGGTMSGNVAAEGSAVYVGGDSVMTMTSGKIMGNTSPRGAVSTGANAVLAFSGSAYVFENTNNAGQPNNVYLGHDTTDIITVTGSGMGSTAKIGVYAADNVDNSRGKAARDFGTYTGSGSIDSARLGRFFNDRIDELYGIGGGACPEPSTYRYITWLGQGLTLQVKKMTVTDNSTSYSPAPNIEFALTNMDTGKQVWSGTSNDSGIVKIPWIAAEEEGGAGACFKTGIPYKLEQTKANGDTVLPAGYWIMVVGNDNSVTWTAYLPDGRAAYLPDGSPAGTESKNRILKIESGELGGTFGVSNDASPKLTFDPNGGTLVGSSQNQVKEVNIGFGAEDTSHTYTINEADPSLGARVFKAWATMESKPVNATPSDVGYFEYTKGEEITFYRGTSAQQNAQGTAKGDLTLYAQWDDVVCKITDRTGELLYLGGVPAVFSTLEECVEKYNDSFTSFTYKNGKRASPRFVAMLVPEYTLGSTITVERTMGLTTATKQDKDDYKYTGAVNGTCVIKRDPNFIADSMIHNKYNLTLSNITLDGNKANVTPVCLGGLVCNIGSSGCVLHITAGATLQNSSISGQGGAVYVKSGTTVNISGGTITGNEVDVNGYGAGIYVEQGGKLSISGNPSFGGPGIKNDGSIDTTKGNFKNEPLSGVTNGGANYPMPRQDIFIAGYSHASNDDTMANAAKSLEITGNISGEPGSIWVWAEESPHHKILRQFAVIKSGVSVTDTSCGVFRNARYDGVNDEQTGATGDYLFGSLDGQVAGLVYWSGIRGTRYVVLRKMLKSTNDTYSTLQGGKFDVYGSAGVIYTIKDTHGIVQQSLDNLSAASNGMIWAGELPFGTYYVYEKEAPAGATGNQGQWFCVLVEKEGVYYSDGHTGATAEEAKAAAYAQARTRKG